MSITSPIRTNHSRRTVLKTVAWGTPVVALAVASPLAAASPGTWPGQGTANLFERSGGGGYGETKGLITNSNYQDNNADGVLQSKLVLDKIPGQNQEPPAGTVSGLITYTITLSDGHFSDQSNWLLAADGGAGWTVVGTPTATSVTLTHPSIGMYQATSQFQIPLYGSGKVTVTVSSNAGPTTNVVPDNRN